MELAFVCVVDDAQWLDRASAQVLTFVARRLVAESVALVLASRGQVGGQELAGLPELGVAGLPDEGGAEVWFRNHVRPFAPSPPSPISGAARPSRCNPRTVFALPGRCVATRGVA
jgi:hypothetical protein